MAFVEVGIRIKALGLFQADAFGRPALQSDSFRVIDMADMAKTGDIAKEGKSLGEKLSLSSAAISVVSCAVSAVSYRLYKIEWLLSCAIASGTVAYHLISRFVVPLLLSLLFRGKYNFRSHWFSTWKWERGFYRCMGVRKWKIKMLTYRPERFSIRKHSLDDIASYMCHAEVSHEVGGILSLFSLFFAMPFGAFFVFASTGIAGFFLDMGFVAIQRYNRPRIVAILDWRERQLQAVAESFA